MFNRMKALKNRIFGRVQQPAPEPAGTEAAAPQEDAALAEIEEAQGEAVTEAAGTDVAEQPQEVEEAAGEVAEQNKAPKSANSLQELGSQLEATKTKMHTSVKGFFGKKNSNAYESVLHTIRLCLQTTSGSFSDNPKENGDKLRSAAFASELLMYACKEYIKKNPNPNSAAGKSRLAKVSQILELAEMDHQGFHTVFSTLHSMSIEQQKSLTWDKILSDIRIPTIEVDDIRERKALGAGVKKGDNAARGLDQGVFSRESIGDEQGTDEEKEAKGSWIQNTTSVAYSKDHQEESTKRRNLSNRNVATSRMANLLGIGGSVAKSTTVKVHDKETNSTIKGNLMEWAEGEESAAANRKAAVEIAGIAGDDLAEREKLAKEKVTPQLMQSLYNLQILDYICNQNDRNTANFFAKQNESGQFVGVQGIDNDMSFGLSTDTKYDVMHGYQELNKQCVVVEDGKLTVPYMDATLADSVLSLKPEEIQFSLGDLLEEDAIAAVKERVRRLQEAIRNTRSENPEVFVETWTMDMHDKIMSEDVLHKRYQKHGSDAASFVTDMSETYEYADKQKGRTLDDEYRDKYAAMKGRSYYSSFFNNLMGAYGSNIWAARFYKQKDLESTYKAEVKDSAGKKEKAAKAMEEYKAKKAARHAKK